MSFGRRVLTFWRLVSDKLFNVWFRLFFKESMFRVEKGWDIGSRIVHNDVVKIEPF